MWRDMQRQAAKYMQAWNKPSVLPRNGLHAARVALVGADEGWIANFSRAVFRANFVRGPRHRRSGGRGGHRQLPGLPASVLDRAASPENKARLKAQTDEAVARGIYGAPAFTVGDELFWGHDRLDQALEWAKAPWL